MTKIDNITNRKMILLGKIKDVLDKDYTIREIDDIIEILEKTVKDLEYIDTKEEVE